MLFLESSIPRANRRAFAFFSLKPYGLALIVKWDYEERLPAAWLNEAEGASSVPRLATTTWSHGICC